MKLKQITIFLSFILLIACSGEDIEVPSPQKEALQLSVSACDFVVNGTPGTRATDDGNEVVFEKDDRIGIIILKGTDGTGVEADNLPYIYDGNEWKFDTETATAEKSGKSVYYYDNKAAKVTYIVYYPYDVKANGAKSKADLKSRFTPNAVQDSKEIYRASDLMVWTLTNVTPQKRLNVQMEHAYFSVSILNQFRYELSSNALGVNIHTMQLPTSPTWCSGWAMCFTSLIRQPMAATGISFLQISRGISIVSTRLAVLPTKKC
ncbi:MAG: fimbrillin family protein [Bacteroides sp.]|nr:fimbrillin family protein [Bacteroides sp.]